ncbi:MAG: alkaline phosphatase family protein [Bdellovibrionaceae bacterium]|nr:alkaline phosphatase family protein [Pseudobdellovibrionaceae bacterium]
MRFALILTLCCVGVSVGETKPRPKDAHLRAGFWAILQGATNATSTEVAVLTSVRETITAELVDAVQGRTLLPSRQELFTYPDSEFAIQKFRFSQLQPDRAFTLRVRDRQGIVRDERELRALDLQKTSVRMAIASCMKDRKVRVQAQMWDRLMSEEPEMIIFGGDNVYIDVDEVDVTPSLIWARYVETRSVLKVFRGQRLIPILATWDDHDYGANDGDRNFKHKLQAAKTFEAFFAQGVRPEMSELRRGPGISSHLRAFGGEFVFLDGRTFRSPKGKKKGSHWGEAQEAWMGNILSSAQGPVWLINGSQFFGKYHARESVEADHPLSMSRLLARMSRAAVPTVLVSGDMHFSEIMRIESAQTGYETYELVSSGMHVRQVPYVDRWLANPRRIEGAWKHNFVLVLAQVPRADELRLHVRSLGLEAQDYFDRPLHVVKSIRAK